QLKAVFLQRKGDQPRFIVMQNAVAVNPAGPHIVQIVSQDEDVCSGDELKVTQVRKEIGLHHCNGPGHQYVSFTSVTSQPGCAVIVGGRGLAQDTVEDCTLDQNAVVHQATFARFDFLGGAQAEPGDQQARTGLTTHQRRTAVTGR
nr:hypothetical protein [Tanacetum cinerariifolium]